MVKGFLRSPEGLFQLSPSVTLVGRENCDLTIQLSSIELQHAVIEYSDAENCFVIQDLNTAHGTYVNDCRVQNAAVRLAPGDSIRFGYSGFPHELEVEDDQVSYPPVGNRAVTSAPMKTIMQDSAPMTDYTQAQLPYLNGQAGGDASYGHAHQSTLPSLGGGSSAAPPSSAWGTPPTGVSGGGVIPRPPRARPSSAGNRRGSGSGPGTGGGVHITSQSPTNSPLPPRRAVTGGWVSSSGPRGVASTPQVNGSPTARGSPVNDMLAAHEKDQRLLRMGDEINRLAVFEAESQRKDGVIGQLRSDMEALAMQVHQAQQQKAPVADTSVQKRLKETEKEVNLKQLEVNALKEKMSKMRMESSDPMENIAHLRSLLHQRERELVSLRQEVEKLRKEKGTSSALMTKLQRDLTSKEGSISRMKGEVELLKKELREKEVALSALAAKFSRMRETKKHEEELASRNKEVVSLKHKLKGAESKVETLTKQIAEQKEEIDNLKTQVEEETTTKQRFSDEKEDMKKKFLESQRAEKQARVDIDQAKKQLERFRSRVMQTTFSAPGFRVPDDESTVTDDSLLETMTKLITERNEAKNKVRELKDTMKGLETSSKENKSSHKTLKQHLIAAEKRLEEGGRTCAHIRNEITLLQSVTVDESLQNVKDTIAMMLQNELAWQQSFETTLEKCGFDIKTGGQDLQAHINNLRDQCIKEKKLKEEAQMSVNSVSSEVKGEMEKKLERLKTEHEETMKLAMERLKLESGRDKETAIEEARQAEKTRLEDVFKSERLQAQHAEASLAQLREALTEKATDEEKYITMESTYKSQIEELQKEESKLREELNLHKEQHKSSALKVEGQVTEMLESHQKQTEAFKEQIRQHALTIVSLEEKVKKAQQDHQTSRKEAKELEKRLDAQTKIAEEEIKRIKASTPAKPVIVTQPAELPALQHTINLLKRENGQLKKEMQDQQDVVLGLRRDLAGASARLSDMTGELSDRQKEEMENQKALIKDQEAELTTQRQQLVKLSELVDRKGIEMDNMVKEIAAQKELLLRQKKDTAIKDSELSRMQQQLKQEQEHSQKAKQEVEQEGLITSELSSAGAQCRGERHSEVIARQREALGELRGRIKGLEQNRPPLPTQDQALQQVILLKKELAEMRAKQAQLSALSGNSSSTEVLLEREVAKARGQISTSVSDAAIERSARVEIQASMDKSETAYMELAGTVARLLGLGEIPGQESLAHLPRDEKERIMSERGNSHELITSRLKTLNQRLERKDALLQDYEKDLEKLRLAERVANEKAGQVESLAGDVRSRQDEAHYLRETLRRTREELDKERRLNSAIKSKKTYHLENDDKNKQTWPKHKCYEDEAKTNKKDAKKKLQKEKFIRKEYEIETLKAELEAKDQKLCQTTARLINMENAAMS